MKLPNVGQEFKRGALGLSLLIAAVCLQGCKENTSGIYQVEEYRCTSEQLDLVKKELDICNGNYSGQYCFLQAKKTQCDRIVQPDKRKD